MPLQKANEIKKIELPSSKDVAEGDKEWVVLEVGPILGGDLLSFSTENDVSGLTINILLRRIKEWNVRDTDGEIAPVSLESLSRLDMNDLAHLLNEFVGGTTEAATSTDPKAIVVN